MWLLNEEGETRNTGKPYGLKKNENKTKKHSKTPPMGIESMPLPSRNGAS